MKKKYFTEEERQKARKEQKKRWDEEHRERKREQDRRWKEKNKEKRKEYNSQYYNTFKGHCIEVLNRCIGIDKAKNATNNLTLEDVMEMLSKGCAHKDVCGVTDWKLLGLNRINNTLPHNKDNCEPCCWECNKRLWYEEHKVPVKQKDPKTDEIIALYPSIIEASKTIGTHHSNIIKCLNNIRKTAGGYKWEKC